MENLTELNQDQLRAVTHIDGSMLVLAGAGSGKTKVLTTRIAWLVKNQYVGVSEILAVTFTNKAAKEMLHRISSKLNIEARQMWVGTFHSIALRLLRSHHKEAGLPSSFQILDNSDQLNLAKRLIKAANFDEERYPAKELMSFINNAKEQGRRATSLTPDNLRSKNWTDLYINYEAVCNRDGLVDFTELLLRSFELLSTNKELLNRYNSQFKHILVDEFQDTNQLQYKWLKLLLGNQCQMFAVGDDDQSIYSFRGAKVANMQTFLRDFGVKEPVRLEQNYRSTPNILAAANAVIGNNSERIGKELWTQNKDGEQIKLYEGYTEEDEAYYVADEIKSLENQGVDLNDIAILYRSNAQSRVFEQLFYSRGIQYRVYGGLRFFDRQEIKHVLAYLRLIVNPHDNEAFLRVVNFPARGIGAKGVENLQLKALEHGLSLFHACDLMDGKPRDNLTRFTSIINTMQEDTKILDLAETIGYVIELSGMHEHYSNDKRDGEERLDNLNELVTAVTSYTPTTITANPLVDFLAHAVLESADHQTIQHSAVQLMTVHAAKGLEFKAVFIVGLEDGLFPHENSMRDDKGLEEERRLMYVALTRAREKLYLLRACSRMLWGKRQSAPLSRFVSEIPYELINNLTGLSKIGCSSYNDYDSQTDTYSARPIVNPESKTSRIKLADKGFTLKIGDMIKHKKFGEGKILRLNADGKKLTAEIFFIGIGKKSLDLNIAPIEML